VGTVSRRSTYEVVRTIREALTALRPGLTAETATVVAPGLRRLLGTPGICLADRTGILASAGPCPHAEALEGWLREVASDGRHRLLTTDDLAGILPVGAPGRTRFITREQVRWVEADGDYVRLHTAEGETFLARVPISRLERSWSPHGFIRIHRGYLVPFRSGPSGARKRPIGAGTVFRYQGMSTFMGFIRMICPI
jgi:hypothetical protein